ncbi:Glycerol-3-phosphate regulon repressor [Microbacterium azadirachtae]|uniref:Lactose phosphotransferase system repressor n=1 Tax=Microbacterium azadirachtae TaxID=582680 RepID=A0A0F0L3C2_9MICO|nr:Glycerol-3-phosphate regulon repressor [Microbacterium azadirachtae]
MRSNGDIDVAQLATLLTVSVETVRRDLAALEGQGLVRRSYGKVSAVESGAFETSLAARELINPQEKIFIADAIVEHLGTAQTIFLDEGVQMLFVAERLPLEYPLTVVTSSLPIATLLAGRVNTQVIMLGGRVRGNTLGVVDAWTVELLGRLNIDLAIIGANGVSIESGMTTPDPSVAAIKSAAIRRATRAVFVGAHHKFGRRTFVTFAQLNEFEVVLTGRELGASAARRFSDAGAPIRLV